MNTGKTMELGVDVQYASVWSKDPTCGSEAMLGRCFKSSNEVVRLRAVVTERLPRELIGMPKQHPKSEALWAPYFDANTIPLNPKPSRVLSNNGPFSLQR